MKSTRLLHISSIKCTRKILKTPIQNETRQTNKQKRTKNICKQTAFNENGTWKPELEGFHSQKTKGCNSSHNFSFQGGKVARTHLHKPNTLIYMLLSPPSETNQYSKVIAFFNISKAVSVPHSLALQSGTFSSVLSQHFCMLLQLFSFSLPPIKLHDHLIRMSWVVRVNMSMNGMASTGFFCK